MNERIQLTLRVTADWQSSLPDAKCDWVFVCISASALAAVLLVFEVDELVAV